LTGDEENDKQQDLAILERYKILLDIIHGLLYGLFIDQTNINKLIPTQIMEALPPQSKKALQILYPTICQAIKTNQQNKNTQNNRVYGDFIHNIFHIYPFEMTTDQPEKD
jgi:DNA replication protein DnaD